MSHNGNGKKIVPFNDMCLLCSLASLVSSLETQGQSVRLGEKARQKFSITKYQVPSKTWDWLVFSHGTG